MTYILISSDLESKALAHNLRIQLEHEGFSAWESVEGKSILGDIVALAEDALRLSSVVVMVGANLDANQLALMKEAETLHKPIYRMRTANELEKVVAELQKALPQLPGQSTLLPRPLEMFELNRLEHHTRRFSLFSPLMVIILLIGLVALALLLFPMVRSALSSGNSVATPTENSLVIVTDETTSEAELSTVDPLPTVATDVSSLTPLPTEVVTEAAALATSSSTPTPEPNTATPRPPTPTRTSTSSHDAVPQIGSTALPVGYSNLRWRPVDKLVNGLDMVFVPAGCFTITSSEVCVESFWISQTEITNEQYAACVAEDVCTPPSTQISRTRTGYFDDPEFADFPVINISWTQADEYSIWAGGSLPTDVQWRYAAQGSSNWFYPWGVESPTSALLNYNGLVGDTSRVGDYTRGRSWIGAFDMAGNVWEWTDTATTATERIVCGGSWNSFAGLVRSDYQATNPQDEGNYYTGFRVILPAYAAQG